MGVEIPDNLLFFYISLKVSRLPLKSGEAIKLTLITKKNSVLLVPVFKDSLCIWSNISICDILTLKAFRWCELSGNRQQLEIWFA